ncbi:hypothetical protein AB0C84_10535 [Actinomadura sp. NPDC048955]|uniref:hypothetical protein n=1 Tax=Actinomadura sp. NPDC048955 TaxID=3158228 RepID=UPI003404E7E1
MIWSRRARALLAMVTCAALTGCGIRPTGIISAGGAPNARGYAATITLYLVRGRSLVPVTRPGLPGQPNLAVQQLSVPPTARERAAGLRTEVHGRLSAEAAVDGSSPTRRAPVMDVRPYDPDARPSWSRTAKAQIACTAMAIPGTKSVNLWRGPYREKRTWETLTCGQFAVLLE